MRVCIAGVFKYFESPNAMIIYTHVLYRGPTGVGSPLDHV